MFLFTKKAIKVWRRRGGNGHLYFTKEIYGRRKLFSKLAIFVKEKACWGGGGAVLPCVKRLVAKSNFEWMFYRALTSPPSECGPYGATTQRAQAPHTAGQTECLTARATM